MQNKALICAFKQPIS